MIRIAFIILVAFVCCNESSGGPRQEPFTLHSSQTNDDYSIELRKPKNFNPNKEYNVIYIPDASIGLGSYVMGRDSTWSADLPGNCVIVAIGHIGDYHTKRSRDFIPSDVGGYSEKNLGHANLFYEFLKNDILPFIAKELPHQKRKILAGHSFSGLFCLYAALQEDRLFDEYFAISPSVWANDLELLKIEEAYSKKHDDLPAKIHLYAGGLEIFNKVLSSTSQFHDVVVSRNYKNLTLSYEKIGGANHYSIRKPAIDRMLKALAE